MNAGFLFLGCLTSQHNPAPFCYIIKHVFKVSYKLTYFVVVNKIDCLFDTVRFFYLICHTSKLRSQKIDLFVGFKYVD